MTLINLPFRRHTFPIIISCLFSAVFFSKQTAKAEEPGLYHFVTGETQKEISFSPELELERLDSLIALDNNNAEYFYNRGWLHKYLDNPKKAEKDYSRAVEIDKGHADAYYNRGLIYMETERYDLAVKDFSEVIRIKPQAADAFCNRGNAYLAKGKIKNALKDFTSAINIAPQDPDLYYNRALLYLSEGKKAKAMGDMREAARLGHSQAKRYLETSGEKL